ncbi:MAG: hypothetical protein AAGL96_06190 [Pseudomonadota bacterium]
MKHTTLIIGLTVLTGLAACGGDKDQVTRADRTPLLQLHLQQAPAPDDHSSRAAIDLLSLT